MNRWIFDTHSHYDDEAFDQDRHELLGSLRDKGVGQLVNVGADMASSKEALALAKQYDFIHAALGVHPSEVADLTEADMDWIRSHASEEKVVAIGMSRNRRCRESGFCGRSNWPEKCSFR